MSSSRESTSPGWSTTLWSWVPRVIPETCHPRFPKAVYKKGNPVTGNLSRIFSPDGSGRNAGILIDELGKASQENEQGISYTYISPTNIMLLINNPEIIKIIYKNKKKIRLHDDTGTFKILLGPPTVLAKELGTEEYKKHRGHFDRDFSPSELEHDNSVLQAIAKRNVRKLRDNPIMDIEMFTTHNSMEMICYKLGCDIINKPIPSQIAARLNYLLNAMLTDVMSGYILTANQKLPEAMALKYFQSTKAGKLYEETRELIYEHILKPHLPNILKTRNWLNENADSDLLNSKTINDLIDEIQEVFFAGMDTSSTSLSSQLRLLADPKHKPVLDKLRAEGDKKKDELKLPPSEWKRDEILSQTYMDQVRNEALRVLPPLPEIQPHKVIDKLEIPGVGTLWPGDLVVISARALHNNKKIWGADADQFDPEQFGDSKKKKSNYEFLPFGLGPRRCPGRHFAEIVTKITLTQIVDEFDFEFVNKDKQKPAKHPFAYHQVIGLRFDEELKMKFIPRQFKAAEVEEKHDQEERQASKARP